jgi:dihydropteroate synthase
MSHIMMILNITPDSFSGDGLLQHQTEFYDALAEKIQNFYEAGGLWLDIGAESTRPDATPIDEATEINRLLPVITFITTNFPMMRLSIDTMRSETARQALEAGANMINDVTAMSYDSDMAKIICAYQAPIILMHNRAQRQKTEQLQYGTSYEAPEYNDFITELTDELQNIVDIALAAGLKESQIILDPGIGFGKTIEQNLAIHQYLSQWQSLGYPILIGASRKSFIGHYLKRLPEERLGGTVASVAKCLEYNIDYIRVHDGTFFQDMARLYHGMSNMA